MEQKEQLEEKVRARTAELEEEKLRIEDKNRENELLLSEVHHRVKNNLQMISSMLSMQERRTDNKIVQNVLTLTKNRVNSIGLIHEHLYKYQYLSGINLQEYIDELIEILLKTLHQGMPVVTNYKSASFENGC